MLCISHVQENDVSSLELEFTVGQLENPFGILNFVKSLKDERNMFYKQNQMGFAIAKYSLALKILSFASVCSDEDKLMFSDIAVSLNLNLGACFIKVKDYDRVGQLCSAVLCFDTTNVKAYFRRAIAALELHKPTLAFMDLAQALKLDPKNNEFQQKLKKGQVFSSQAESDMIPIYISLQQCMERFSKGEQYNTIVLSKKKFITIRVANHVRKMDSGVTQESATPMEFSHPPVEGHDRLSGSKRLASCPIEFTWFPNHKKLYGPTPNVLSCNLAFFA
uniref:Uncharacterized protein n=1 Tax=Chenopodium quinoa TaxID=63459 RepID=A0A803KV06_CHEQI